MPVPLAEVVSDFGEVAGQDKLQLLLEFANALPPLPDLGLAALISPLRLRGMSVMLTRIKRRLRAT